MSSRELLTPLAGRVMSARTRGRDDSRPAPNSERAPAFTTGLSRVATRLGVPIVDESRFDWCCGISIPTDGGNIFLASGGVGPIGWAASSYEWRSTYSTRLAGELLGCPILSKPFTRAVCEVVGQVRPRREPVTFARGRTPCSRPYIRSSTTLREYGRSRLGAP